MSEVKNSFDVTQLEKLKGNETVSQEDLKALKGVLDNKDDLFKSFLGTKLEKNVQKKMEEIFKDLNVSRIEALLKGDKLSPEEKNNLMLLLDKYKERENEKEKNKEIQDMIQRVRMELQYFQGQVMEQSGYKAKNLRETTPSQQSSGSIEMASGEKAPESQPTSTGNGEISEIELDNLEKFLGGKDILTDKLTKVEKSLKSDFMKMLELLSKKTSLTKLLQTLNAQMKNNVAMPDWKALFPKGSEEEFSDKDVKKLQKGYQAYLESKTSNPDLSRWNQILNLLETGILNEGKSLNTIKTESLNKPISKKERKQGLEDEQWRWRAELAKDGKASEWKTNYLKEHHAEVQSMQQMWLENGYSGAQISQMTKDFLEDQFDAYTKKEWRKYLKEQEKNGIQKSDLGKFRVLVDSLKDKSDEEKILALMTDTNFDGMRNHLDGKGTKRGLQVDAAFHMAKEAGKTPEDIVKNIGAFMKIRNPGVTVPTDSVKSFSDWLSANIANARAVQSALMDSPAQAVDIMTHGSDAMKKTLEKNKFSPEDLQKIQNKVDTDPATKDLPAATKAELMSSVPSYLLTKMQEKGANASVNGLGVGVNVSLSQILEGLSFTLGTGTNFDGGLFAGVGLAWNNKIASWETGSIDAGLKAGTTLGVIPIYGLRAGFEQELNTKAVLGDIDPTALKSVSFGANITMIGALPSWGLNAGFDADKVKGIEKQYNAIKKDGLKMMEDLLKTDKSVDAIKTYLINKYPKSTDADIAKAAENLSSALKLAEGLDQKTAAKVIADWYAESWRNTAIQGLPKGRKPTGAGIGIQFLAGFFPVGSLSMTLTRYKNESYEDSPESRQALRQREELGIGNETAKEVKKSDFDRITTSLQRANILTQNEKLEMSDDGFVAMPVSLLNKSGLEVRIANHLQGYIKQNGNALHIPADIAWRFLDASRTNGSRAVLNIGGDKSQGMKLLTPQNINAYIGDKDHLLDQNVQALEKSLKGKNLTNLEIKDGKLYQDGKEIGPLTANSGIKIDASGNVSLTSEKGKVTVERAQNLTTNRDLIREVESVLTPIENDLRGLDNQRGQFENFKGFLKNAKAMSAEYFSAASDLIKMFGQNKKYEGLKTALAENKEKNDFANPTLAYQLMDRIKSIFATIPDSLKSTRASVVNLAKQRDVEFRKNNENKSVVEAFSGGKINIDYTALANELSDSPRAQTIDNLIGFTAFYKRKAGEARGMSMTAFGQTNVLDKTFQIEEEKKADAKQWLIDNLKKHSVQLSAISTTLGKVGPDDMQGTQNGFLPHAEILKLINGEEISLDNGKKKVTLKTKIVKYFLAECANESIGIQLEGLNIQESSGETLDSGSMTFNASETLAKANIQSSKFNVGISFVRGEQEQQELNDGEVKTNPVNGQSPDSEVVTTGRGVNVGSTPQNPGTQDTTVLNNPREKE